MLSWEQVLALPMPAPVPRITFGAAPQQFGELRLPARGDGPHPVLVLVHGGCWLNAFDHAYMSRMAAALTDLGAATWTVEYRRLGDRGGGWPGTFLDVAQATDHLRTLAALHPLDPQRTFALGHSAGGQLALWLAARHKLPRDSDLYLPDPLPIRGVAGLAAITDLVSYRVGAPGSCNASVDALMGGSAAEQPARYAQASPLALLALGVPQWLVHGALDPIVSVESARDYAAAARRAGDEVDLIEIGDAGHFEVSVPGTGAFASICSAMHAALAR